LKFYFFTFDVLLFLIDKNQRKSARFSSKTALHRIYSPHLISLLLISIAYQKIFFNKNGLAKAFLAAP